MCLVKTPKIKNDGSTSGSSDKPLPILRNPLLDGISGSIRSLQLGRAALRIDRVTDSVTGVSSGGSSVSGSGGGGSSGSGSSGSSGGSSGGGGSYYSSPYLGGRGGGGETMAAF